MIGYEKSIETKVIRRQHKVGFNYRTTVGQLIKYLSHVPPDAKFIEYSDDEEIVLIFEEEKKT